MDDSTLNQIVIIIYMIATVIFLYRLISRERNPGKLAMGLTWAGFAVHTASLAWRWIHSYKMGYGHAPLSNRYESLVFFGWCIILMFLILAKSLKMGRMGAFIVPLGAAAVASTGIVPGAEAEILPLMPALQSNWLIFHVVTCFLGYSSFAIACFAGIISLIKHRSSEGGVHQFEDLDSVMYRTVVVGFLLLTLGIISGSAWAYNAWGRYWGWDPKEVWSLITWIVYAIFLHARVTKGWSGRRLAWISIIGFFFVLFTFLGVNYLPIFKGLHSYA